MPRFKGFKFSFNLTSSNDLQPEYSENNVSPVYITGAYKVIGDQFYGATSYGGPHKKITPGMVKLPPSLQPNATDSKVIETSKSTSDLTNSLEIRNLPPNLRKSTPEVSSDPRGTSTNDRKSTDLKKSKTTETKKNKDQAKLDKKRQAEEKKQEKIETQKRAKEESLRKEREKAELKEQAKQEKLRIQKEKAEAANAKKEKKEKKVPQKTRTNPLAQGPNAPLPYTTNTLQSSISKASGPPPYEATNAISIEARSDSNSSLEVVQNESDDTGNTSFGAPIEGGSTWDLVAQHRVQVSRAPAKGVANKVAIRLQEPLDPNVAATGRKSLYV